MSHLCAPDDEDDFRTYMAGSLRGERSCKRKLEQKFDSCSPKQKIKVSLINVEDSNTSDSCNSGLKFSPKIATLDCYKSESALELGSTITPTSSVKSGESTYGHLVQKSAVQTKAENADALILLDSNQHDKSLNKSSFLPTHNIENLHSSLNSKFPEVIHSPSGETSSTSDQFACFPGLAERIFASQSVSFTSPMCSLLIRDRETPKKRKQVCFLDPHQLNTRVPEKSSYSTFIQETKESKNYVSSGQISTETGSAESKISWYKDIELKKPKTFNTDTTPSNSSLYTSNLGNQLGNWNHKRKAADRLHCLYDEENLRSLCCVPAIPENQDGTLEVPTRELTLPEQVESGETSVEGRHITVHSLLDMNRTVASYVLSSGRATQACADVEPSSKPSTIDKDFEDYFSMLML